MSAALSVDVTGVTIGLQITAELYVDLYCVVPTHTDTWRSHLNRIATCLDWLWWCVYTNSVGHSDGSIAALGPLFQCEYCVTIVLYLQHRGVQTLAYGPNEIVWCVVGPVLLITWPIINFCFLMVERMYRNHN